MVSECTILHHFFINVPMHYAHLFLDIQGLLSNFTILGANSADNTLTFFLFFSKKIGFGISCKLSPNGDNLHEMSKPIFSERKKILKNVIY